MKAVLRALFTSNFRSKSCVCFRRAPNSMDGAWASLGWSLATRRPVVEHIAQFGIGAVWRDPDDSDSTGIHTWSELHRLGVARDVSCSRYLGRLDAPDGPRGLW
ncbi:MAG: hypothetical protein ABIU96_14785 [Rhodanobacter sp.]